MARGFAGSAGIKLSQTFLGLLLSVLLARVLGAEGYGIYAFAFSVASLLAIPVQMGLPVLVVREVAHSQLKNQWGLFRGLLRRSNQLVVINSAMVVGGAAVYIAVGQASEDPAQLQTMFWALMLVPLIALGNLRGAILSGLHKVVQGQLPEMLLRPLFLVVMLLVMSFLLPESGPDRAMLLHCVASAMAFLVGVALLMKAVPAQARRAMPEYRTRAWLASLLPLAFIAGMQVINSQADIFMLGLMASKEEVGIYRIVVQGATLVGFPLIAVNAVIAPQITRLYQAGDKEKLQQMVTISARVILVASMPLALVFICWGRLIIEAMFGNEFAAGALALAILSTAQLLGAFVGSVALLLNMTGHENDTARGVMLAAGSNILLNLWWIPAYGIEGAAAATAVSLLLWNGLLYIKVRQRLQLDSLPFLFRKKRV